MTFWTNSGFEPKRAFRFKVTIAGIEPFYVKKITKPKFTLQEAEHKFLNRSYFFPGHVTWDPVTVTFVDDSEGNVMSQLTNAITTGNYGDIVKAQDLAGLGADNKTFRTVQKKSLTQSTADGVLNIPVRSSDPESNSTPILIEQIDSTDLIVVEKIELYNGWIKSITPSELSYDTEDLSSYDVEIRYDWAAITGPENR
jgi:hypothetical protein